MSTPILGIDLGTTNSAVGVVDSGFPILLADSLGKRLTPSVVYYLEDGGVAVGEAAARSKITAPDRVISSIKRKMGEGSHPEEVSAEILKHLKGVAETALEQELSQAVITVPAYFNDAQRNATKRAGELAGLEVVRILNEPTAAALAYGLDKLEDRSTVAVYDLGGGTFDISILELHDGVFRVLATQGDTLLGGDDIDAALAEHIWREGGDGSAFSTQDSSVTAAVLGCAETAKKELSVNDATMVRLPFILPGHNLELEITREDFDRVSRPILRRTVPPCRQAIADSGVPLEKLDAVILVGGSTRSPGVRSLVKEVFEQEPDIGQHPDEAIALGAVIQAGIIEGSLRNMVLLDVTPLSLGIETFGGLMNVIIPRNTTIPAKAGEMFTNAVPNQEKMLVRVLQGEREIANDNWELGKVELQFTPGPKASARVGVQFRIDENGILEVLARDTATNEDTVLEIQSAAVDVDDEAVETMISESVEHAFTDMAQRQWVEDEQHAQELLAALAPSLEILGAEIDPAYKERISVAEAGVRAALEGKDHLQLKEAAKTLEAETETLAVMLVEKMSGIG